MRKYWYLYKTGIQQVLAYRGSMIFWLLGNICSLLAIISVWLSSDIGKYAATYTKNELITYYVLSLFLWQINGWVPTNWIKDDIKDGKIVGFVLLKPISFYWRVFAGELAWHSVSIFFGFAAAFTFWYFLQNNFVFLLNFSGIFVLLLSIILSIFIILTISICVGIIAFWFTEISTIEAMYWAAISLLGGGLLPLSFIPLKYQTIVKFLPFRYITSFPLEIYFGKLNNAQILAGFLIGASWVAILTLLYKFMWAKGVKVYKSWGQ